MSSHYVVLQRIYFIMLWPVKQLALLLISFIYRGPTVELPRIKDQFLKNSAVEIARKIRKKELTSVQVTKACINRIQEVNQVLNCVVLPRFSLALQEAEKADLIIAEGSMSENKLEREKPFLGVPFTAKDGIAIEDHRQVVGMEIRKNEVAEKDADTIAIMREAGAIPLGTTNVPEMMMWWETNNKVFGRTKNPYHTQYIVAGSSGGEASLLAAAGSFFGIGSDLAGSIRLPASFCGIFGHFPTRCLVPHDGHYPPPEPEHQYMISQGPMSKSAKDLKPLLKTLTKSNEKLNLDSPVDITQLRYFYMDALGGSYFATGMDSVDKDVKKTVAAVVKYLNTTYGITAIKVQIDELKDGMNMWYGKNAGPAGPVTRSRMNDNKFETNLLLEFIKQIFGRSKHTLALFFVSFMEMMAPPFGSQTQIKNLEKANILDRTLKDLLRDDAVFICPTQPTPPIKHNESLFRGFNISYTSAFNATTVPVTQCPISQTKKGLPLGVQIVAAPYNDRLTLAVAEELEKGFGGWKTPPETTS